MAWSFQCLLVSVPPISGAWFDYNMILFEKSLCYFRMVRMWSHNILLLTPFPVTVSTSLTFMLLLSTDLRLLRSSQWLQSLWDLHRTSPCHSWGYALITCKYSSLINAKFHTLWVILCHQQLCHITVPSLSRPVGNDLTSVFMWEMHWFLLQASSSVSPARVGFTFRGCW